MRPAGRCGVTAVGGCCGAGAGSPLPFCACALSGARATSNAAAENTRVNEVRTRKDGLKGVTPAVGHGHAVMAGGVSRAPNPAYLLHAVMARAAPGCGRRISGQRAKIAAPRAPKSRDFWQNCP